MPYTNPVKFSSTDNYGGNLLPGESDVYTVDEFREHCRSGSFIDYDGFGEPMKDNLSDLTIWIRPSQLHLIPADATHIVWFNR